MKIKSNTHSYSFAMQMVEPASPISQKRQLTTWKSLVASVAMALGVGSAWASVPLNPAHVGEVSMVLGKAWVHSSDGSSVLVKRGTTIDVNDIIETDRNGHVHVQFVDTALISVRPSSKLKIIRYEYNQENPAASVVKLFLEEGITRAISGKAAKAAKESFRMNTPIAAIGVRGTDFAVSVSQSSVRALVNEGAIILAPFSSSCIAAGFGPCSQNALELAGGDSQIIEMKANALEPVFLPASGASIPEYMLEQSAPMIATAGKTEHEEDGGSDIYTDSVTTLAVNRKISDSKQLLGGMKPVQEFTPDVAVSSAVLTTQKQLVWGRWSESRLQQERITVSYAQAFANNRQVTIGNDHYVLFRFEQGSKEVKPGIGVLAFDLTQAQAMLTTADSRDLMDVYGGLLNIDFDERRFSTSLELGHSATGKFTYSDSGRMFGGGIFRNLSDAKTTVGTLSVDGSEAGYFFETTLDAGKIEGLTLWSVKP